MASYKDAGVDIDAGNLSVERMSQHVLSTHSPQVLQNSHGGFAGMFQLDGYKYKDPILVSCTDGVGTKLEIAHSLGKEDTIGIDLVAMCVNDLIVYGAKPLFFLDYIAVDEMDPDKVSNIVKGIATGCREAGCAILGGETAEMRGFFSRKGQYELAGFSVGVVEKDCLIDGSQVAISDDVIGISSSGIHSNGLSLVREIFNFEIHGLSEQVAEELLIPTRIYVKPILSILETYNRYKQPVKAMAHITGGGLIGNVERILPPSCDAKLEVESWTEPPIFDHVRQALKTQPEDMFRVFNMGIGMVLVVENYYTAHIIDQLNIMGFEATKIGKIVRGEGKVKWGEGDFKPIGGLHRRIQDAYTCKLCGLDWGSVWYGSAVYEDSPESLCTYCEFYARHGIRLGLILDDGQTPYDFFTTF